MYQLACFAHHPLDATHILLDLLPPHPAAANSCPTAEQTGFIEHQEGRKVLSGYWALECLRIEGVGDTGFWDLSEWVADDQGAGAGNEGVTTDYTVTEEGMRADDGEMEDDIPSRLQGTRRSLRGQSSVLS